jgi:autophagy-related protein 5
MTMSSRDVKALQQSVWQGSVPLEIRLASKECTTYGDSDSFLVPEHPFLLED